MPTAADHRANILLVIAGAALLIGIFDLFDATIYYGTAFGVPPIKIPQSITSGILGRTAYSGGMVTAILGLALHFMIAFAIAAVYILASTRLPLSRRPILSGAAYGVAVYFFMNYLVLPLSNVYPRPHYAPGPFANGIIGHILLIGIPVALIARRYVNCRKTT
jgi:uncharacterized membrane protein YagU involved in acid resistance